MSIPNLPRAAENFVLKGCDPVQVCYLETYIWTNCDPVNGFAEIYANDCTNPEFSPIRTATATKAERLKVPPIVYQGVTLFAPTAEPSGSLTRHGELKPDNAGRSRGVRLAAHGKMKALGKMKNGNGHRKGRD